MMKQNCKWLAALFMAASATLAFGQCNYGLFGPRSCTWSGWNVPPVGERVVTYSPDSCSSCSAFAPTIQSYRIRTIREPGIMPVAERFTVTSCPATLEPVGERFTTVRVIRYQPMLEPVGERFTTVRVIRYQPLEPVGERITTVRTIRYQPMLQPVGESCKVFKHKKVLHKKVTFVRTPALPVAEKTMIVRHHKILKPVGQRVLIRSTTTHLGCGCGG